MSELSDAATFATDPDLQPVLAAAMARSAVEIYNEDPDTEGHDARKRMASAVLANPPGLVATFAWALSTNATVVGKWINGDQTGAEGDFAFVLGSIWDAVAGA